jgi:hypothetical protein
MIRKNIQVTNTQDEFLRRTAYETRISEAEHIRRALDNYFFAMYGQNYKKEASPMEFEVILTDGQEIAETRTVTQEQFDQLQDSAKESTDGNWHWARK